MHNQRQISVACLLLTFLSAVVLTALGVPECHAQSVIYSLDATANGLFAGEHRFGFHDEASDGLDDFDAPEPPVPPESYLGLAFVMPDTSQEVANRWRIDIRDSQSFLDMVELWELRIETDQLGAECEVILDHVEGGDLDVMLRVIGLEPGDFEVPVPGSFTFQLTDPEMVIWLEMFSDKPIPGTATTWGGIKACYR
jgi:hypothetical protein